MSPVEFDSPRFGRVVTAMVTPFDEYGALDVPAGAGSNDTAHSIDMTRRATETGVDGVLIVTPYYNRPSQAGLFEHFREVAEAAGGLPVVLYDIPARSGRRIATPPLL